MGFNWIVEGVRMPIPLEFSSTQRQVKRVQQIEKEHKPQDNEEDSPHPKESVMQRMVEKTYRHSKQMPEERKQAVCASQIMTSPVITLEPDNTIEDVWNLILKQRFRHVPIVTKDKTIVGIVSDRDMLREIATMGAAVSSGVDRTGMQKSISSLIKTKVLTASPETEIREIAHILFEKRIGSMPILDENGRLIGIITRSDILRAIINHAPFDLWI
jgi:acetoin utilization protein AcuB